MLIGLKHGKVHKDDNEAREANAWKTICAKLVKDSAHIVEDLLELK